MKILYLLLIPFLLSSCIGKKGNHENQKELYWGTLFADAVMNEADSLIYYKQGDPKFEYDFAFLAMAIDKLADADQKYADYSRAYIDYFVQDDGSIDGYQQSVYNIDRVRPGWNLVNLYEKTGEIKYKLAADKLVGQMETHPRTRSGGFWHKKIYPWQMWLDGIYMAQPFLCSYAKLFDMPEWYDEAAFQIELIYEKTMDPGSGLLYHAWDESKQQAWCNPETGQSKMFWSRAMGWFLMANVEVLEILPNDHPEREKLISIVQNTAVALLKVQDQKSGLWYQVLDMGDVEGNYIEATGSAMFTYAMAKGARLGILPESYRDIASKAFDSIIEELVHMGEDGFPVLTNVCGSAGLGGNPYRAGDFDYYINEKRVDNDSKGIAPLIMAAVELGK